MILESLSFTKTLYAFDFDGTLSRIVRVPSEATVSDVTNRLLIQLSELVPVAIISGRSIDDDTDEDVFSLQNNQIMTVRVGEKKTSHARSFIERQSGLSLVQWCLLKQLIDMPAAPAHSLARAVGVHPSTLTQTLKRLERRKYMFITEDPKDSRKKLISMTRIGMDALETANGPMKALSDNLSELATSIHHVRSCLKTPMNEEI